MAEEGAGGEPTTPTLETILPKDFEGRDTLVEKFKNDPVSVAKSYRELERKMGSALHLPGADASDEDWEKYNKRVTPESHEDYPSVDGDAPDTTKALIDSLKAAAKEAGVHTRGWGKLTKAAVEASNAQREALEKVLLGIRAEWEGQQKEKMGAKCGICKGELSFEAHEKALLVGCLKELDCQELKDYLLSLKDKCEKDGYAGFAFKRGFDG